MPAPLVKSAQVVTTEKPVVQDVTYSGSGNLALGLTLSFIFLRFSFLHELLTEKLGVDLHLLMILGGFAVLASLLSGSLLEGFTNKISLVWFGFAGCMLLATLGSVWRGGSLALFYPYLRTTLILVVLIPAIARSSKSLLQVVKTIGAAGLATVLLGLTMNDFRTGRLELSAAGSSISNSNDYAAIIILVMPAIGYLTLRRGSNVVMKLIGICALAFGCFLVLSTGSRGALLSMILSTLYLLKVGSGKVRAAILIGLPLIALVAVPFLPGEASVRLQSLFSNSDQNGEATASKLQRTELLTESIRFTFEHPLLGIGPGTFEVYQAQAAAAQGEKGMWHETHNSYTQVSSECGIPALLFYLAAILLTFLTFSKGRKSDDPDIRAVSSVLALMLVSFCVCMFFLSQAYGFGFPVLGGIAISLDRLLKREAAQEPFPV